MAGRRAKHSPQIQGAAVCHFHLLVLRPNTLLFMLGCLSLKTRTVLVTFPLLLLLVQGSLFRFLPSIVDSSLSFKSHVARHWTAYVLESMRDVAMRHAIVAILCSAPVILAQIDSSRSKHLEVNRVLTHSPFRTSPSRCPTFSRQCDSESHSGPNHHWFERLHRMSPRSPRSLYHSGSDLILKSR